IAWSALLAMTTKYPASSSSSVTSSLIRVSSSTTKTLGISTPSGGHIQATTACIKPGDEPSFLSTDRRSGGGRKSSLGSPSTACQDLKLHHCHSPQYGGISLAVLGGAKNRFRNGLDMRGTHGIRQRGNRAIQRHFHDRDRFRRKRRIREVFHLDSIRSLSSGSSSYSRQRTSLCRDA